MKRLLATCFGLGRLPCAPGTWASLPPAVIFGLLWHLATSAVLTSLVMAVLTAAGSVVCILCAPAVIAATGNADPREVVADEFAGQALTFLAVPFLAAGGISAKQVWAVTVLGFLLFRLFDIVKPWPVGGVEKLPEGWGILADDLLAGVYSAVLLVVCFRLWIARSGG